LADKGPPGARGIFNLCSPAVKLKVWELLGEVERTTLAESFKRIHAQRESDNLENEQGEKPNPINTITNARHYESLQLTSSQVLGLPTGSPELAFLEWGRAHRTTLSSVGVG